MKPLILTTLLVVVALLCPQVSLSQTVSPPDDVTLMLEFPNGASFDLINNTGDPDISNDSIEVLLVILLPGEVMDTLCIKAGTTSGGNDLLEHSFALLNPGSMPGGVTCTLEGMVVRLSLGTFYGKPNVFAEVSLKDDSGNASSVTSTSIN